MPAFAFGQSALLALLMAVSLPLLVVNTDAANTVAVFLFAVFAGLYLCRLTRKATGDPRLRILGVLWLIKLAVTLVLLFAGWAPSLDPEATVGGYDPQRYFRWASELAQNGWEPEHQLKYQGIVFYYGAMFHLFGHNAIVPAIINAFVTLAATLYLVRVAYEFQAVPTPRSWIIAFILLVPELLWYDVMTSRETITAALIVVATLAAGRYIVRSGRVSWVTTAALVGVCLGGVLLIRTSMAVPVIAAIVLISLLLRSPWRRRRPQKIVMAALVLAVASAGPLAQDWIGGGGFDYAGLLTNSHGAEVEGWSDNSVGRLLAPDSAWAVVGLLPARMVLYLAAPLPNLGGLAGGGWAAWQSLMAMITSALNLVLVPYVLAGTLAAWRQRRRLPGLMVIVIAFWVIFAAVVGGNVIIHERYRVMSSLLFFAVAWIGYTIAPRVRRIAFAWLLVMATGAVFYAGYKLA